jgi:hypothetical protein
VFSRFAFVFFPDFFLGKPVIQEESCILVFGNLKYMKMVEKQVCYTNVKPEFHLSFLVFFQTE